MNVVGLLLQPCLLSTLFYWRRVHSDGANLTEFIVRI